MSGNFRRYFVRFSYIGTSYRGTQRQTNINVMDIDSVQGAMESAFFRFAPKLKRKPFFVFAGRTDAGVHSLSTAAHVDLELLDGGPVQKEYMIKMMNRYLINSGHQIRIFEFYQVSENFHARHCAKRREYLYRFLVPKYPDFHQVPVAELDRTLHVHFEHFDREKFKSGLKLFNGTHDFTTFSSMAIDKLRLDEFKSHVRTMQCHVEEAPPLLPADPQSQMFHFYHVHFVSKGFLYKQIRKIIGTLLALAANKIDENDIMVMLKVPNRKLYRAVTALPHGLYLRSVTYDKEDVKEIFEE